MPHIHIEPGQHDVTVSAYVLRRREDGEWLCFVHMHRKIGKLMQLGGHVELNESPWASLVNELKEEGDYEIGELSVLQPTNVMPDIPGAVAHPVPALSNTHRVMADHYHSDYEYVLVADAPPKGAPAKGESQDLRWLTVAELKELVEKDEAMAGTTAIYDYIVANIAPNYHPVPATNFSTGEPGGEGRHFMATFYFMRHGECQANAERVFAGIMDSPLTDKGRKDARDEGERLATEGMLFDLIITSSLSRAYDTAVITAKSTGYDIDKIIVEDLLTERSFGDLAGKPWSCVENEASEMFVEAGAETISELASRVAIGFDRIRELSRGKKAVLIVGHGSWYQMADTILKNKKADRFLESENIPNNKTVKISL